MRGVGGPAIGLTDQRVTKLRKTADASGPEPPGVVSPLMASTDRPGTQRRRLVKTSSKPPQPTCRSASVGYRRPVSVSGSDQRVTWDFEQYGTKDE